MTATHRDSGFFTETLSSRDPELYASIADELGRQREEIELIASENIVSRAVLEAQGSVMTNKYAEGYPGKRYYGGCQFVDMAENARHRAGEGAVQLQVRQCAAEFGQPDEPGRVPGAAAAGRHLHGARPEFGRPPDAWLAGEHVGKWFNVVSYGVRQQDQRLDMDGCAAQGAGARPKLIIAGGTAYSRDWDWAALPRDRRRGGRLSACGHGAYCRTGGGGRMPRPFPHAHVVTTTTHKSLRGPRGGMILTNDEDIAKKVNSAVFPGLQGGPLMHVIAAKAVAFGEALQPEFKTYAAQVKRTPRRMAETLNRRAASTSCRAAPTTT
jgi:glycine hydroxymethyltransferase